MQNILVVKLGGALGADMPDACRDLAEIARQRPLVVVHGVSERMAELSAERNMPVEMLASPSGHSFRYTPPDVRDLFAEACRSVNREVVGGLRAYDIDAVSMMDAHVINGERKNAIRAVVNGRVRVVRDDYSGSITGVSPAAILAALEQGQVAVIPPLAMSDDGLLNIDGDRGAAAVAAALNAEELVILSNVRGLYRSFPDESSFVPQVERHQLATAMQWAQGRMKRKVLSAQEAIESGIMRVIIGDGRIDHPISYALQGQGTVFTS